MKTYKVNSMTTFCAIEFIYTLWGGEIRQGGTVFVTKYKVYNI